MTTTIEPSRIVPLHEVRDEEKLAVLRESMRANGWQGRPLLVLDLQNGRYAALTGSHRLPAAQAADVEEIPAVVIQASDRLTVEENWREGGFDLFCDGDRLHEDEARLAALEALGLDEAAALMAAEVEANEAA